MGSRASKAETRAFLEAAAFLKTFPLCESNPLPALSAGPRGASREDGSLDPECQGVQDGSIAQVLF